MVSLGVDEHYALLGRIASERFIMLSKMKDYYLDADFSLGDLGALKTELGQLCEEVDEPSLVAKLTSVIALVDDALAEGCGVSAIAD